MEATTVANAEAEGRWTMSGSLCGRSFAEKMASIASAFVASAVWPDPTDGHLVDRLDDTSAAALLAVMVCGLAWTVKWSASPKT